MTKVTHICAWHFRSDTFSFTALLASTSPCFVFQNNLTELFIGRHVAVPDARYEPLQGNHAALNNLLDNEVYGLLELNGTKIRITTFSEEPHRLHHSWPSCGWA